MKILVLTSSLGSGGAERVATTLCNFWAARGDDVSLIPTFSGGGKPFYEVAEAVELVYLADALTKPRGRVGGYVSRLLMLRKLISKRNPDVVISFLPNVNVAAIVATRGLRVPLIICERSDPSVQPYSFFWKRACQVTYRFADMLTVQTESVAVKAKSIFPGLKSVRPIPNPLPAGVLPHAKEKENAGDRKVLLSIGRLAAEKQVDAIIAAFAEIADEYLDWDLHIYGDGPLRPSLAALVDEYGIAHRAFLKGRTNFPWQVMADSHAFVMTSAFEGFPNALLEAMGTGLPCIAFDCPSGPREISNDGANAVLVRMNDHVGLTGAMRRIMGDEVFRGELGNMARSSVLATFDLPAVAANWDRLFQEVGAV